LSTFSKVGFLAFIGACFYWLSLPPFKQPWAGYIACGFWSAIIAKEQPLARRDYWMIWMCSALMWLALLQGIRLANPILYLGWAALSLYVAIYLPLSIALARSLHQSFRIPLPYSAATAWVGGELVRAYFASGFSACMLAHSQTPWPWMLPLASQLGAYGVSFIVMFTGATLYLGIAFLTAKRLNTKPDGMAGLATIAVHVFSVIAVMLSSFLYLRSHEQWIAEQEPIKPLGRVLIIQDDMPTMMNASLEEVRLGWHRYEQQNNQAAKTHRSEGVDLVLWPESTFSGGNPWIDWDKGQDLPADWETTSDQFAVRYQHIQNEFQFKLNRVYEAFGDNRPYFLVGSDVLQIRSGVFRQFNAALWLDPNKSGNVDFYGKQHLVMFGEYIPILTTWFPDYLGMFGMGIISAGDEVKSWKLPSGATISTTICFEDVVPQFVRSTIRRQSENGSPPDLLVNLTNDAWFRGSSILDHHLNNAILAAVENRRPMLVAANQGISAWIDSNGRVVRSLPRLDAGSILAEPIPDGRWGLWQSLGDLPAKCLAILGFSPWLFGLASRIFRKRTPPK